jgi:hypothetical protein
MESDPIRDGMMMLGDILFPSAAYRRSTLSILSWWESRRGLFNLIVGGTGLFTLLVVRLVSLIPPSVPFMFDWRVILAYGLLANVCYTFGWAAETAVQRLWGDRVSPIGPALFRQGIAFSIGLTLLPTLLVSLTWVVRTAMWILK